MNESTFYLIVIAVLAVLCFLSMVGLYTVARDSFRLYRRWRAMR